MMRSILTLCCLALLGGAIAAATTAINGSPADRANGAPGRQSAQQSNPPGCDRQLDCQHSLPLVADADETDSEELSGRDKALAAHHAGPHEAADPSASAARFEAALQYRPANTLNALGVRLQI